MDYCPNTLSDAKKMLETVGAASIDDLFKPIPQDLRARSFRLPKGLSEHETAVYFKGLSGKNAPGLVNFIGGGIYDHIIPSAVNALAGRAEFFTAYTPYQPECSQGTLQALFEYQTAICVLTGMEATNASMYDGATALAESVLMAVRVTGRSRVLLDEGVNPHYRQVIGTYLANLNTEVVTIGLDKDAFSKKELSGNLNDRTAAAVFQNPNFLGSVQDLSGAVSQVKAAGALAIACVYPVSLGLLKTPGETGFDIAAGDGQCLGNPMGFGGPSLGFIACRKDHIRNLPGRIIGETSDKNGRRGYVLTLQAREQHIKRHKATSNICSNESLCALRALVYLCALGREGFRELAEQNYHKAEFAKARLGRVKGVKVVNRSATFNEFTVSLPVKADKAARKLLKKNIAAGIPLGGYYKGREHELLVSVTEKRTRDEITALAKALKEALE